MSLSPARRGAPFVRALALVAALVTALSGGIAAASTASAAPRPQVVQLGDSYAAGNGTLNYTDTECFRSPDNYGGQVARRLGATFTNVACSGAVVADLTQPAVRGASFIRVGTYSLSTLSPSLSEVWLTVARASNLCGVPPEPDLFYTYAASNVVTIGNLATGTATCQLMARPQIDAVTSATTHVFVTIGGNDLGFATVVADCFAVRVEATCRADLAAAQAATNPTFTQIAKTLAAIKAKSGGRASVTLVGYPYLSNTASYVIPEGALPGTGYDCAADLEVLQGTGDQLGAKTVAALGGARAGYTFVNVKSAWGQHRHGFDPHLAPDNSASWIWPLFGTGEYHEWAHPKSIGWSASAAAVATALRLP